MKNSIVAEIRHAFDVLNKKLFDGALKPVEIAIQPKKKVGLRFLEGVLVVGVDFPILDYDDLLCALLHEMLHISNYQTGTIDVTTNQYHNKTFLTGALALGLTVIKHKTQGWAITTILYPRNVVEKEYVSKPAKEANTRRLDAFNAVVIDKNVLRSARQEIRQKAKEEKPTKTYFLKYTCNCPPPHNSIRSGRRPDGPHMLNIQCLNCRSMFLCDTPLKNEEP